ncbi:CD160 antigen-like [Eublepharis macularius]|uniref:CD160 antigen-like n=1 Tax=Eublepharis macularius TaxID=481883 RepID=A0AA97J4Q5_EUBMA|nr:CD160 antigen-like [Eublepharis macularius]
MMTALDWQARLERNYLASAFLTMLLGIKISGGDTLEIIYPTKFLHLQEGDSLILNCTVVFRQGPSDGLDAHWCKQAAESSICAKIGVTLEKVVSKELSDFEGVEHLTVLLRIPQVNVSDSGNYQCRAQTKALDFTAMGHYIRVNVSATQTSVNTSSKSYDMQRYKALGMDFQMLKTCVLILALVAIMLPIYR